MYRTHTYSSKLSYRVPLLRRRVRDPLEGHRVWIRSHAVGRRDHHVGTAAAAGTAGTSTPAGRRRGTGCLRTGGRDAPRDRVLPRRKCGAPSRRRLEARGVHLLVLVRGLRVGVERPAVLVVGGLRVGLEVVRQLLHVGRERGVLTAGAPGARGQVAVLLHLHVHVVAVHAGLWVGPRNETRLG